MWIQPESASHPPLPSLRMERTSKDSPSSLILAASILLMAPTTLAWAENATDRADKVAAAGTASTASSSSALETRAPSVAAQSGSVGVPAVAPAAGLVGGGVAEKGGSAATAPTALTSSAPRVAPEGRFYLAVVPLGVPAEANLILELNGQRVGSYALAEYQIIEVTPQLRAGENQALFSFTGALESTEVQLVLAKGHTPLGDETLQLDIPIIRLQRGGSAGAMPETFRFSLSAGMSSPAQP